MGSSRASNRVSRKGRANEFLNFSLSTIIFCYLTMVCNHLSVRPCRWHSSNRFSDDKTVLKLSSRDSSKLLSARVDLCRADPVSLLLCASKSLIKLGLRRQRRRGQILTARQQFMWWWKLSWEHERKVVGIFTHILHNTTMHDCLKIELILVECEGTD